MSLETSAPVRMATHGQRGDGVVLSRGQIAALSAMRATAPAFLVAASLSAEHGTVEVEVEDGRRWLIDLEGKAVRLEAV